MEEGNLAYRIPVTTHDEIGTLAHQFNGMAETLQRSFGELEEKNRQLSEQFHLVSRSQKEWAETFDSIKDPIALIHDDCSIVKANLAFEETFKDYLSGDDHGKFYELFNGWLGDCPSKIILPGRMPITNEINMPKMGKTFQVSLFPYSPGGAFDGAIFVAKDVTEKKENETRLILNDRLSALGQLASNIAHEIRTPLATIKACSDALSRRIQKGQWDSPFFEKYLGIVREEILRCIKITDSMLFLVRKTPDQKKDISIHPILDKTLEMLASLGRLREIEVVKKFKEELPPIKGNEDKLKQVFLAIIGNSLDAMEDGGTLTLETGVDGDSLFIRIGDSGPGIPPGLHGKIFEPFFTTKSEKGGTGLGLTIADKIIKDNSGKIEVTSEEGRGTIFKIILPRE